MNLGLDEFELHCNIDVDGRIQLIEFLISDYLLSWSTRRDFDSSMFFPKLMMQSVWVIKLVNQSFGACFSSFSLWDILATYLAKEME